MADTRRLQGVVLGPKVLSSEADRMVLGQGSGFRAAAAAVAVLLTALGILASDDPVFVLLFVAPFAIWSLMLTGRLRTIIRFNRPPGFMSVTYYTTPFLGQWPFLRRTTTISLRNVDRMHSAVTRSWMQTGSYSAVETLIYSVSIPDERGNSLRLYKGSDPAVAEHLRDRIREAASASPESDPLT